MRRSKNLNENVNLKIVFLLFTVFLLMALPAWAEINAWSINGPGGAYIDSITVSPGYGADATVFVGSFEALLKDSAK